MAGAHDQPTAPAEPPESPWHFPSADQADEHGMVGVGADLEPGTLLAAYRAGLFPMPTVPGGHMAWWSPDPRGIVPLDGVRVSRSLRRSCRRFTVTLDAAFDDVVHACADPGRPHGWIDGQIRTAYGRLHRLGWAHSIEVWSGTDLVGGLYGVAIGGLFAGESMFHRASDASKVALVTLTDILRDIGATLLDVQWLTPHLETLGAVRVERTKYLDLLRDAIALTAPWPGVDAENGLMHAPGRPMESR